MVYIHSRHNSMDSSGGIMCFPFDSIGTLRQKRKCTTPTLGLLKEQAHWNDSHHLYTLLHTRVPTTTPGPKHFQKMIARAAAIHRNSYTTGCNQYCARAFRRTEEVCVAAFDWSCHRDMPPSGLARFICSATCMILYLNTDYTSSSCSRIVVVLITNAAACTSRKYNALRGNRRYSAYCQHCTGCPSCASRLL